MTIKKSNQIKPTSAVPSYIRHGVFSNENIVGYCDSYSKRWLIFFKQIFQDLVKNVYFKPHALHKKWSFPLRISSVNVAISAGNCGFGHIYWRNP